MKQLLTAFALILALAAPASAARDRTGLKPKTKADFQKLDPARIKAERAAALARRGPSAISKPSLAPHPLGGSTEVQGIRYGSMKTGTLQPGDHVDADFYTDRYEFFGYAGDIIDVALTSPDFDAFLIMTSANYQLADDNSEGGTNARLFVELPETGYFRVNASSVDPFDTGDYDLNVYVINDATFVDWTLPALMQPDESQLVIWTVKNLGEVTWNDAMDFRLAAVDNADPFFNGTRIRLRGGDVVRPGETYDFYDTFKAPTTPGNYLSDWRMTEEDIEYFGDTLLVEIAVGVDTPSPTPSPTPSVTPSPTPSPSPTPQQALDAIFGAADYPALASNGDPFPMTFTVNNSGTQPWTADGGFGLAAAYDPCGMLPEFSPLAPGTTVAPGADYDFTLIANPPTQTVIFFDDFEGADQGWTGDGLWHKVDETSAYPESYSPTRSWYYGTETNGTYDEPPATRNYGTLYSPFFDLPAGEAIYLTFNSWEETELSDGVDVRTVYVDDGTTLTAIASPVIDTATWRKAGPYDLTPFAGKRVSLLFDFDTIDGLNNAYGGWYVDDVTVSTSPCFADLRMSGPGGDFGETLPIGVAFDGSEEINFAADGGSTLGWYGGVVTGDGSTFTSEFGLCMDAPLLGDNTIGWVSPDGYVELKDKTLYHLFVDAATDQTAPDAIPFWQIIYDNYNYTGKGNNYGGEAWFLDVAEGANGVGRDQGRRRFHNYIAPNAALTPQWRGLLSDGTEGVFTPAMDASNDWRLVIRELDTGSAGINANIDVGLICISTLRIDSFNMDALVAETAVMDLPIVNANFAAYTYEQNPLFGQIDDGTATASYQLDPMNDRATMIPALGSGPFTTPQLYPVSWESNQLLRTSANVRLAESSTGVDPIDIVSLLVDTATNELGQVHLTTRANAGNFLRAGSPRKASVAGGDQTYTGFFFTQNKTAAPGAAYLRPMVDLVNSDQVSGLGTGSDVTEITGLKVERITLP